MLKIQLFFWRSILYRSVLMGVLFSLLISPIALADPPPDPKEQSVPVQLRLIRENLVLMEERLSLQMTEMEGRLDSTMADIQSSVDVGNGKMDVLQASANEIITTLNTPVIGITTQLCLDEKVMAAIAGGAHGEFGVGWPNVLDAKAIINGDAGFGVEVGLGNQICIEIPLYSVDSDETFLDYLDFNTTEFDFMISSVAAGAQLTVPIFAEIYGALMPTPEEAVEAFDNYLIAGADYSVLGRSTSLFGPEDLVTPHVLLEPVIPDMFELFIMQIPGLVDYAVAHPCEGLEKSPLGAIIDKTDPAYSWFCDTTSGALSLAVEATNVAVAGIKSVVDFIKNIVKCIWEPWTCLI